MKHLLIITALLGLAACETTEGFGRDVQTLGNAIEDESQQAQ